MYQPAPVLPLDPAAARRLPRALLAWYRKAARALPWRATSDPWRILLAEVMLQQTRVVTVIPYYERFVERFPTPAAMAEAPEDEVLVLWSGLGYYSRARNLKRAAEEVARRGGFPRTWEDLRTLPGVGDYTAAAVGSIAFGLPHAVVDGNVLRVLSRASADRGDIASPSVRRRLGARAQELLAVRSPGDFNQALMELGATVCTPRNPDCRACPWRADCLARLQGIEKELPRRPNRRQPRREDLHLLLISRRGRVLLYRRPDEVRRLAGFWDLPSDQQLPGATEVQAVGAFRHGITHDDYLVRLSRAVLDKVPRGMRWKARKELASLPLTTMAKKAFRLAWPGVEESE
jgi:A/G-specific adenine glycosylase